MQTAKQEAEAMIRALPDDASIEDIQYQLHVLDRVQHGLEDLEAGRTLTSEEVKARLARWRAA